MNDLSSMPLLEIASTQSSLQSNLAPRRACSFVNFKAASCPFTISGWRSLEASCPNYGRVRYHSRRYLTIKAIATLESSCLGFEGAGSISIEKLTVSDVANDAHANIEFLRKDSDEIDERERMRRIRISKANKGNTPWNKGKKHSPETVELIRERTRLAMQNPKVKVKLANIGHAQSEETKQKIAVGVRIGWRRRRERLMAQEMCYFEWQNLIAEASRSGIAGEDELQWDSYNVIREQLDVEWVESIEQRKTAKTMSGRRAPKSAEQRRKIAEAIAVKWADPEYRERVCSGIFKYHGSKEGERKTPRPKKSTTKSTAKEPKPNSSLAANSKVVPKSRRSKELVYKDPMSTSKLEILKHIRARRAAEETKKAEAIERARLLIAEAEKAARALEAAAARSPVARASLDETRKLIAEAVRSIESVSEGEAAGGAGGEEEEVVGFPAMLLGGAVNGMKHEKNGCASKPSFVKHVNGMKHEKNGSPLAAEDSPALPAKKWVRGRLVEVAS